MAGTNAEQAVKGQSPAELKVIGRVKTETVSLGDVLKQHYGSLCKLAEDASDRIKKSEKIPEKVLSNLEFAIDYAIIGTGLIDKGLGGAVYLKNSFEKKAEYISSLSVFYGKGELDKSARESITGQAQLIADAFNESNPQSAISDDDNRRLEDAARKIKKMRAILGYED